MYFFKAGNNGTNCNIKTSNILYYLNFSADDVCGFKCHHMEGGKMQNIKNISILKYGLAIVVLCFFVNLLVYMSFSIEEAVFLKHYYDIELNNNTDIHIHFVTNSIDTRKIVKIKFPQMPDDFAHVDIIHVGNGLDPGHYWIKKFAHYSYHDFLLQLWEINSDESYIKEESVVLDKAVVIYSNGEEQEVNIGKIVLHKNVKQTESLTSTGGGSYSGNKSTATFISNDNFVINSITSELDEEIKDIFKLSLNGKNIEKLDFPIKVTSDDSLTFESQFIFNQQDMRRYNVYEIQKRIFLTDSEGNKESERILNIDYEPAEIFLKEKDIIRYLKEIGVK